MENNQFILLILCLVAVVFSTLMVFFRNPLSVALSLLMVLLASGGIYGLMGEHMVAAIQLVVYAGAIMVLFIFAIMLLNMKEEEHEKNNTPTIFMGVLAGLMILLGVGAFFIEADKNFMAPQAGPFTSNLMEQLGGNTKVLAHALFSQGFIPFEAISLALLVAIVGAVVLAKRKFDQ